MTTRQDVTQGFEAVDARVRELTPRLVSYREAKLPEGEWRVCEALCHLAARANSVPVATAAAQRARARARSGPAAATVVTEIDEMNRQQIANRRDRTVQQLIEEIHAGHQSALKAVREFDQSALDERFPSFTSKGEMSFAELLLLAGPGHENRHLDQIEKAMASPIPPPVPPAL